MSKTIAFSNPDTEEIYKKISIASHYIFGPHGADPIYFLV